MKDDSMPDEPGNELAEEISKKDLLSGIDFSGAREWLSKSGLNAEESKKEITKKILEILSQYLSKGLLQLTIEEIANEKECRDAIQGKKDKALVMNLSKDLPPFNIYVETIIKSGSIELKKIKFEFAIKSNVAINDAKIIISKNKINSIKFGSFSASITLYLVNGQQQIKLGTIERSLSLGDPVNLESAGWI
ncbi:Uncharacterised protein [uncultured archaeon]|nr:Uncharacterised protein [uncultured archaeon]